MIKTYVERQKEITTIIKTIENFFKNRVNGQFTLKKNNDLKYTFYFYDMKLFDSDFLFITNICNNPNIMYVVFYGIDPETNKPYLTITFEYYSPVIYMK